MLNFVWALCAVKYQGPLQYTLSALAKNSTFSVHNGEKSDMKNALYVRRGHFTAVSEGFEFHLHSPVGDSRKLYCILFKCICRYWNLQKFVTFLSHSIVGM